MFFFASKVLLTLSCFLVRCTWMFKTHSWDLSVVTRNDLHSFTQQVLACSSSFVTQPQH